MDFKNTGFSLSQYLKKIYFLKIKMKCRKIEIFHVFQTDKQNPYDLIDIK